MLELESDFSPFIDGTEGGFELVDTEGISRTTAALGVNSPGKKRRAWKKLPCVNSFSLTPDNILGIIYATQPDHGSVYTPRLYQTPLSKLNQTNRNSNLRRNSQNNHPHPPLLILQRRPMRHISLLHPPQPLVLPPNHFAPFLSSKPVKKPVSTLTATPVLKESLTVVRNVLATEEEDEEECSARTLKMSLL